jgi:hypothetical protein
MAVEDVFTITGRGTVATGRVERGVVKVGDEIEIIGLHPETKKTVVTGVEMFRKLLDQAQAGDNIGVLLRGIARTEIERGQVLAVPGSVTPHTDFMSQVYILTKDEGGRHTPFFDGYRPQFYFRTTDVTGVAHLPEGTEMVMPGDNVEIRGELIQPIAMEEGLRFAIRGVRKSAPASHQDPQVETLRFVGDVRGSANAVFVYTAAVCWFDMVENGVLEYPTAPEPLTGSSAAPRRTNANSGDAGLHGMQAPQLHHQEEQAI